jgi:RNA polymerase sigma-70 factor (ECF subfamily)
MESDSAQDCGMTAGVSLQAQLASLRPMLLKMAHLHLRNKAWAEDAVHDALLAVLEQPERFAGRSTLGTYIGGILKYKVVDMLRLRARECALPEGELPASDEVDEQQSRANPVVMLEQAELFKIVGDGLAQLPERSAAIFLLRAWDECETGEVCAVHDVTVSNLHAMGTRTRKHLRNYLAVHW